jgi:hypothetical protein
MSQHYMSEHYMSEHYMSEHHTGQCASIQGRSRRLPVVSTPEPRRR